MSAGCLRYAQLVLGLAGVVGPVAALPSTVQAPPDVSGSAFMAGYLLVVIVGLLLTGNAVSAILGPPLGPEAGEADR